MRRASEYDGEFFSRAEIVVALTALEKVFTADVLPTGCGYWYLIAR